MSEQATLYSATVDAGRKRFRIRARVNEAGAFIEVAEFRQASGTTMHTTICIPAEGMADVRKSLGEAAQAIIVAATKETGT